MIDQEFQPDFFERETFFDVFFQKLFDIRVEDYSTEAELDIVLKRIIDQNREKILANFPEWQKIAEFNNGVTELHTAKHYLYLSHSEGYQRAGSRTKNILRWISFFHDTGKFPRPYQKKEEYKRDPSHPFVSAVQTIGYFQRLGLLRGTAGQVGAWKTEVMSFVKDIDLLNGERPYDRKSLKKIMDGLDALTNDSDIKKTIKTIFFHQSLPSVNRFPRAIPINPDDSREFIDEEIAELLLISEFADANSWRLFDQETARQFESEISANSRNWPIRGRR